MREARIIRQEFSSTSVTYRLFVIPSENGQKVWTFMKPSYFRRFVGDMRYHHVWLHASARGQVNKTLVNSITKTKRYKPQDEPPFWGVRILTMSGPVSIYFKEHNATRHTKPKGAYIPRYETDWKGCVCH